MPIISLEERIIMEMKRKYIFTKIAHNRFNFASVLFNLLRFSVACAARRQRGFYSIREGNRKRFKMCCLVNPDPRPEPGSVEISAPVCPPLQGTEHFLYDNKVAAPDIRLFISDIQPNIKILFKKQRPETSIAHWRF